MNKRRYTRALGGIRNEAFKEMSQMHTVDLLSIVNKKNTIIIKGGWGKLTCAKRVLNSPFVND